MEKSPSSSHPSPSEDPTGSIISKQVATVSGDSTAGSLLAPAPLSMEVISHPEPPEEEAEEDEEDEEEEEDPLAEYQEELQNVLEYVDQGMILKSFSLLEQLTEKIVTNIEPLGLATDDHPSARREGFWRGLNNCWLFALSHAQDKATRLWSAAEDDDGPPPPPPISSSSSSSPSLSFPLRRHLVRLKQHVVEWANRLEPWGLVDYELGLWERDILEAIESCLDVVGNQLSSPPSPSPSSSSPSVSASPSAAMSPWLAGGTSDRNPAQQQQVLGKHPRG
ncbi:hypothetical protein BGW42_002987 [Actinomortierella wolfii]|nr:hypothetical protein BGW42_002987 [Actinomortierella wolfii]